MASTAAQQEFDELMRDTSRRTRHPSDDNDDARSFLNLSDDDDDGAAASRRGISRRSRPSRRSPDTEDDDDDDGESFYARPSLSISRHTIPRTRYGANTGPKGVISDAQNYRDSQRRHRLNSKTPPTISVQHISTSDENGFEGQRESRHGTTFVHDDSGDEEDIDFMDEWRTNRLKELQNGSYHSALHNRERRSERHWGGLQTVDAEGYLDAVDRSPGNVVVAVYIYDDSSEMSLAFEDCLRAVADKYSNTRFVRLHYTEAEMEPAGVPGLIAYRGGEKFTALVPLAYEMPDDAELDATTLETVLRKHVII